MARIRISAGFWLRVACVTLLSMLALSAAAHEVEPTIGDVEVIDGRLVFALNGNFEALVADVDLSGLTDINTAPEASQYDALRALSDAEWQMELERDWADIAGQITVLIDGQAAPLTLDGVTVIESPNLDLVRPSTVIFSAAVPEGAETFQIDWPARFGDLVLRQMGVDKGWDGYLTGGLSEAIPLAGGYEMSAGEAFYRFIPVGVEHIVPLGLDHILFVLGLFFLSTRMGPLLWQVTAFTAAHTVTLALATLGYVTIADEHMWVVESIIAASIVYVAVENIFTDGLNPWRPAIIFGFGLLHGLGFASVLGEYGLPEGAVVPALLGFNIGVELGQLMCISIAFLIVFAAIRSSEDGKSNRALAWGYMGIAVLVVPLALIPVSDMGPDVVAAFLPLLFMVAILAGLSAASCAVDRYESYRHMVAMPASIGIALVGAYWVVERVFL